MNIKTIRRHIDNHANSLVLIAIGAVLSYLANGNSFSQELFVLLVMVTTLSFILASWAIQYIEYRRANAIRTRVKEMLRNRRTKAETPS